MPDPGEVREGHDVLVVGAGPTGLVLALWLTRLGVRVRIVDREAQPGTTSRAIVVQPRTLELYRQIGLDGAVVAGSAVVPAVNFWSAARPVARLPLAEIGRGLSPFPEPLSYPQDEHERLLIDALAAAGVRVERPLALVELRQSTDHVDARLRSPDGREERCRARYVCGCDGAHSTVREASGLAFPGGTYSHVFYVADAETTGPQANGELHVTFDEDDFLGVFPLRGPGRARLIGTVKESAAPTGRALGWADVSQSLLQRLGIEVRRVNWFSTYRVHHRMAARFRRGRVFVLGDAAHIHSPVGGQGMNTGIGDAVNLAWKLADVLAGRAHERLLDTYAEERMPFARRLLATTDRLFELATSPRPWARGFRTVLAPRALARLMRLRAFRRLVFRIVSQTAISYRGCLLNAGSAGGVHGGDRLPYVTREGDGNNFAPLTSLSWQLHVAGRVSPEIARLCADRGLPVRALAWHPTMREAGLVRDAIYLVRPDGYVALVDRAANPMTLVRHLDTWGLHFGLPAPRHPPASEERAVHA